MTLDEMMDSPGTVDISDSKPKLPKGRAKGTLVSYGATRDVASDKGIWKIQVCNFLVEGTPYNEEINRPSITPRYELWIAVDENGNLDTGTKPDGSSKNRSMASFFKAFGRSTAGTSFNDLIGCDAEVTLDAEIDNRSQEPTGFVKVTGVYKAA